jgi:Protein of unknown function (DUF2637)
MSITYRGWAYTGAALGGGVSIAANVAHSYVPPTDWVPASTSEEFSPQLGAVIGAVVWPLALFVAVEILARTPWPAGRRWVAVRYLGLVPVALVAAFVSYRHLSGLLAYYHEDSLTAAIGPLAVDGLMVMATAALLAAGHRRHTGPDSISDGEATHPATPSDRASDEPTPPAIAPPALPTHLLPAARFAVTSHEQATGRIITAGELATRMSITSDIAAALLTNLNAETSTAAPVNGSAVTLGASR